MTNDDNHKEHASGLPGAGAREEVDNENREWLYQITEPLPVRSPNDELPPELAAYIATPEGFAWQGRNTRPPITEAGERAAEEKLRHFVDRDPEAADIIHMYQAAQGNDDLDGAVALIRDNHDLRFDLALYLWGKKLVALAEKLPERVANDAWKFTHDRYGYPDEWVRGSDYAVLLALAMLDGTFDEEAARFDAGEGRQPGQHRTAARMLINDTAEGPGGAQPAS